MKAAVLTEIEKIEVKDVPKPVAGEGDILIEVKVCAICGTDLKIYKYGYSGINLPFILGHELAGIITETKSDNTKFKIGDRVTINPNIPCETCYYCVKGLQTACDNLITMGVHIDGGFAEFMKIPAKAVEKGCIFHIPENVPSEEVTLIDPASCVVNAAELSNIEAGDTVVVIGAGPAGCLNIEVSKAFGATKTVLVETSEQRLYQAAFVKADVFINSSKEDPLKRVLEETDGRGADKVIVACASTEAQALAIKMTAKRGTINLFGGLPKGSKFLELDSNSIHYKELYVTGTHGGSNRHCKIALELIAAGKIQAKEYLSYSFELSDFYNALKTAEDRKGLKVLVRPN
jgi:L-iditol 2-dehydrogenase